MKKLMTGAIVTLFAIVLAGCSSTWEGVKKDTGELGAATERVHEMSAGLGTPFGPADEENSHREEPSPFIPATRICMWSSVLSSK